MNTLAIKVNDRLGFLLLEENIDSLCLRGEAIIKRKEWHIEDLISVRGKPTPRLIEIIKEIQSDCKASK